MTLFKTFITMDIQLVYDLLTDLTKAAIQRNVLLMLLLLIVGVMGTGCGDSSSNNGNNNGVDTTPNLSNGAPAGVLSADTNSALLSITTDVDATCKYDTASGVDYSAMAYIFSTSGGLTHTSNISGFSDGQTYNYYARCRDGAGTVNSSDYLVAFAIAGVGGAYYVSPTGSATWTECTDSNTPCSGRIAVETAMAGDTVYFRGGTYNPISDPVDEYTDTPDQYKYEWTPWNPQNSGVLGSPITFKAYPGETPIMLGRSTGTSFGTSYRDYIVWDGFSGTSVSTGGVTQLFMLWHSTGSKVINSDFSGFHQTISKNTSLIRVEGCIDCEVYNNRLHDMTGEEGAVNTCVIWSFNNTRLKVHHNTIYNTKYGYMAKTGMMYNEIYLNYFYNLTSSGLFINSQSEGNGYDRVYQNVLVNTGGIFLNPAVNGVSQSIYNNTIYGTGSIAVNGASRDSSVFNNIISNTDVNPLFIRYYQGLSMPSFADYNNFYGTGYWNLDYSDTYNYYSLATWSSATGFDTNSIASNPLFVTPGGTNPDDYKLQSDSPAINAGIDRQDYDNNGDTTESISMGAYITGTEIIGIDY